MSDANFWPVTLVDWAQVVSAIGTAAGAIATAAAVVVTLRLARRDLKEHLFGYIGYSYRNGSPMNHSLNLELTNRGARPATVSVINLEYPSGQWDGWGKPHLLAKMFYAREADSPSTSFTFGQSKEFRCELDQSLLKHVHTIQDARLLRMIVDTTTDTTFIIKPPEETAKFVLRAAISYRARTDKDDESAQQP